ncbi:MAG TPA: tetratricopeptide repeat protein [Thermoanaerobaculia bacterium]|nr:tetratricopeptide repeat protein [Thermoanaerobaculia bacterium]
MSEGSWVRRSLEEAVALATETQNAAAIACLEEGLRRARQLQDRDAISSLARHAGLQSYHLGEYQQAVTYYEEALGSKPTDAWLHLALAEAYAAMEQAAQARQALEVGLAIAIQNGDAELAEIIRGKAVSSDTSAK